MLCSLGWTMIMLHIKNRGFQLRLIVFLVISIFLVLYFKTMTENATIDAAMKKTEMMLMTNRAISEFVSKEQKTSIQNLKEFDELEKNYFNPKLQSGSYITKQIHYYYNLEQERQNHPTHAFKFASTNPLNEENRATTLEEDILHKMNEKGLKEHKQLIEKDGEHYLYYALALEPISQSCLRCHGDPEDAPKSLVETYGTDSGFGYKIGDIVAMNSIYTPVDEELKEGQDLFLHLSGLTIFVLSGIFLLTEFMFSQSNKKRIAEEKNRLLENELEYQNLALQKSLTLISQHIMLSKTDLEGKITEVSEALCRISGYTMDELIGKEHSVVRHPDTSSEVFQEMWERIKEGETWQGELKNRNKDGSHFWVDIIVTPDLNDDEEVIGYSSFWHDASHKKRMEMMSITDTLTKLYNRRFFQSTFENERLRSKRDKKYFSFLMLDLDFFKRYNDTYGHQAGDDVLRKTAEVMRKTFRRAGDFCFRLGGEEFGVIYSVTESNDTLDMAKKLCENIEGLKIEHKLNKASKYVSASIGVTMISPKSLEEIDMDGLISKADEALYKAKHEGRNRVHSWIPTDTQANDANFQI